MLIFDSNTSMLRTVKSTRLSYKVTIVASALVATKSPRQFLRFEVLFQKKRNLEHGSMSDAMGKTGTTLHDQSIGTTFLVLIHLQRCDQQY
jgi:hypothetical protein